MSDNFTDIYEEEKSVESDISKCTACGANMHFDPETQTLTCEHCGNKIDIQKDFMVEELAIDKAFSEAENWSNETTTFRCDNCGASVVLDNAETATKCPFCGTGHVVKVENLMGVKPNVVIPFLVSQETATQSCKKWAKKKLFSPRKFKKRIAPEKIQGVYTPVFTFDSDTFTSYRGVLGERYTVTVGSGKNRRTETRIRYFPVAGTMQHFFDDITIEAGPKFDQKTINKLMPFQKEQSVKYDRRYLTGFMANHYDVGPKECWKNAASQMDANLRQFIKNIYHADVIQSLHLDTQHRNVTYKLVMLPVYVGNYSYNKKVYNFYVNGSTSRVYGKAPLSPLRIMILLLFILGVVGLVAYAVSTGGGG